MGKPLLIRKAFLLICLCGIGVALAGDQFDRARRSLAKETAAVIPDTSGAIDELLLQYDPDQHDYVKPLYDDLFSSLPDEIHLIVLCPSKDAAARFLETWSKSVRGLDLDLVIVGLPITVWARDRCIARQPLNFRGRSPSFVPSDTAEYGAVKLNDLLMQDILFESRLAPEVLDLSYQIEGGNVVSNQRHVFIGANIFEDNRNTDRGTLAKDVHDIFGRDCVILKDRDGQVPWCHTDMYFTPIDERLVLVASPMFAWELVTRNEEDLNKIMEQGFGEEEESPILSVQSSLDDVALQAKHKGYRVLRLPAIVNETRNWMITYNNVLMDKRGNTEIVYMPVYGIPSMDNAAIAIYRSLGFEVVTVDASKLYESGGTVRCVANVVRRKPSAGANLLRRTDRDGHFRLVNLADSSEFEERVIRSVNRLARRSRSESWNPDPWNEDECEVPETDCDNGIVETTERRKGS